MGKDKDFRDDVLEDTAEKLEEILFGIANASDSDHNEALGLLINNLLNVSKVMNMAKDDESFMKAVGEFHGLLDREFFSPLGLSKKQLGEKIVNVNKTTGKVNLKKEPPKLHAIEVHVVEGENGELDVELSEDLSDAPDEVKHGLAQKLAQFGVKPDKIKRILGGL